MYAGYKLSPESRARLLKELPPLYSHRVLAHHITTDFLGNRRTGFKPPQPKSVEVIGHAHDPERGIHAAVVRVDGNEYQGMEPEKRLHVTISHGPKARPVHSNDAIKKGFEKLKEPISLTVEPMVEAVGNYHRGYIRPDGSNWTGGDHPELAQRAGYADEFHAVHAGHVRLTVNPGEIDLHLSKHHEAAKKNAADFLQQRHRDQRISIEMQDDPEGNRDWRTFQPHEKNKALRFIRSGGVMESAQEKPRVPRQLKQYDDVIRRVSDHIGQKAYLDEWNNQLARAWISPEGKVHKVNYGFMDTHSSWAGRSRKKVAGAENLVPRNIQDHMARTGWVQKQSPEYYRFDDPASERLAIEHSRRYHPEIQSIKVGKIGERDTPWREVPVRKNESLEESGDPRHFSLEQDKDWEDDGDSTHLFHIHHKNSRYAGELSGAIEDTAKGKGFNIKSVGMVDKGVEVGPAVVRHLARELKRQTGVDVVFSNTRETGMRKRFGGSKVVPPLRLRANEAITRGFEMWDAGIVEAPRADILIRQVLEAGGLMDLQTAFGNRNAYWIDPQDNVHPLPNDGMKNGKPVHAYWHLDWVADPDNQGKIDPALKVKNSDGSIDGLGTKERMLKAGWIKVGGVNQHMAHFEALGHPGHEDRIRRFLKTHHPDEAAAVETNNGGFSVNTICPKTGEISDRTVSIHKTRSLVAASDYARMKSGLYSPTGGGRLSKGASLWSLRDRVSEAVRRARS